MSRSLSNDLRSYGSGQRDGTRQGRSEADDIQRLVDELSRWMDAVFEIPGVGWRFGLDALIGLVPFVGDAATTLVSLYILGLAQRAGVPRITVARMAANVAIDMILGSVPIVGDAFDMWWKANLKNAALLRDRLTESPRQSRRATVADWAFMVAITAGLLALLAGILILIGFLVAAGWHVAERLFG